MPRLAPSLLRHAASRNRHLPQLLQECRDLASATNELRWLTEHAALQLDNEDDDKNNNNHDAQRVPRQQQHYRSAAAAGRISPEERRLMRFVRRRSKGEPLQYILGSQPFGDLEILCRKGVLIPRPETELYTTTLAEVLNKLQRETTVHTTPLKIVDLCTGTGCITLLLHALLRPPHLPLPNGQAAVKIQGVDVSSHALRLAQRNLEHNLEKLKLLHSDACDDITFCHLDVLRLGHMLSQQLDRHRLVNTVAALPDDVVKHFLAQRWDVIISNPPYISPSDYAPGGTVGRSVRDHEPKLALVPPPLPFPASNDPSSTALNVDRADQFYVALLHIARKVEAKILVMEIGDAGQAERVRRLAREIMSEKILVETWTDDGHVRCGERNTQDCLADAAPERAVVLWQRPWAEWRRDSRS